MVGIVPCKVPYLSLVSSLGRALHRESRRGRKTGVRTWVCPSTTVATESDPIRRLPTQYLRASDANNFDRETFQRNDVDIDGKNGKVRSRNTSSMHAMQSCVLEGGTTYRVTWDDGTRSEYSARWVHDTLNRWLEAKGVSRSIDQVLWRNMDESSVRTSASLSFPFSDALEPSGTSMCLKALYQYGFALITDTPVNDGGEGVSALAAALSGGSVKDSASSSLLVDYASGGTNIVLRHGTDGPLRTLYGSFWSTSANGQAEGTSVADSAYTNDALPLHTDMTYLRDPPGLQIFTMAQPAERGGESIVADGFSAAEYVRQTDPSSFDVLSSVHRTYRCIDQSTGWHLQGVGPVISVRKGSVVAIRHNDLDRLPDLPPVGLRKADIDKFYQTLARASQTWDDVLNMDDFRLVMPLKRGETLVVANQRCLHARHSFETGRACRTVMGCYVSQDELSSRFRMEGFNIE